MAIGFDESVRNALVENSEVFNRFVRIASSDNYIGLREAKVLQVNKCLRSKEMACFFLPAKIIFKYLKSSL